MDYSGTKQKRCYIMERMEKLEHELLECSWCGGEIIGKVYNSRQGEMFCSKNHRDQSTTALRNLRQREKQEKTRRHKKAKPAAFIFSNGKKWWYYDDTDPDNFGFVGPFISKKVAIKEATEKGFEIKM